MRDLTVSLSGAVQVPTPLGVFCFQEGDRHAGVIDQAIIDTIRRVVKPGMVVADVGANVGYFTRLLSELVGEHGQVHALEPVPELFQLLLVNCPEPNVIPYRIAASDVDETATLMREATSSACGSLIDWVPTTAGEPCVVHARRLGELLPPLDFAIIDTEGLDPKVVAGFIDYDEYDNYFLLPAAMIVEHWADGPSDDNHNYAYDGAKVRAWYERIGYRITDIDGNGNLLLERAPSRKPLVIGDY